PVPSRTSWTRRLRVSGSTWDLFSVCSTSSAPAAPITISGCGACGTWWPGTRAGWSAAPRRLSLRRLERHADEVLGPDRLPLTGLDTPHQVGQSFDASPQRHVELSAQPDGDWTCFVEGQIDESHRVQQLRQGLRCEDGDVGQVAVDHLVWKEACAVGRLDQ